MKAMIQAESVTLKQFIVLDAENPQDHFDLGVLSMGVNKDRCYLTEDDGSGNFRLRIPVEDMIKMAVGRKGLSP